MTTTEPDFDVTIANPTDAQTLNEIIDMVSSLADRSLLSEAIADDLIGYMIETYNLDYPI